MLRLRLTTGRKLDTGNPNPGNIGSDFAFFSKFEIWDALDGRDAANRSRQRLLLQLNAWRNAIAHQDFDATKLGGRNSVRLSDVRRWRRTCDELAVEMDAVVAVHVATITGVVPW